MVVASCAAVGMEMRRPHAANVIEDSSVISCRCRNFHARTSVCHRATSATGGGTLLIVVIGQLASRTGSSPSAATYRYMGDNS